MTDHQIIYVWPDGGWVWGEELEDALANGRSDDCERAVLPYKATDEDATTLATLIAERDPRQRVDQIVALHFLSTGDVL